MGAAQFGAGDVGVDLPGCAPEPVAGAVAGCGDTRRSDGIRIAAQLPGALGGAGHGAPAALPRRVAGARRPAAGRGVRAGPGDGAGWAEMLEDLADFFEQGAANGTPIRELVGDDPVEFVEAFVQNYPEGQWRIRERDRLVNGIKRAAGEDTETDGNRA